MTGNAERILLSGKPRRDGISGFLRVMNDEDYLAQAIASHLPFLDELVIVVGPSEDRSLHIAESFQQLHPEKIDLIRYPHPVRAPGTAAHRDTPATSDRSYVKFSAFAVEHTNCRYVMKVDADHIVLPEQMRMLVELVRREQPEEFLAFSGINLWDEDGCFFVPRDYPRCGVLGDCGIFPVREQMGYEHVPDWEVFRHRLKVRHMGPAFYHMKFSKHCRGMGKYDLWRTPESIYTRKWREHFAFGPVLVPIAEYLQQPDCRGIPLPAALDVSPPVRPVRRCHGLRPFRVRKCEQGDEFAVNKTFNRVFSTRRSIEECGRKFDAAPPHFPPSVSVLAEDEYRHCVGIYPAQPALFHCDHRRLTAAQVVDDGILPEWRKQGIQRAMRNFHRDLAKENEIDLVYGFPGPLSFDICVLALGYRALCRFNYYELRDVGSLLRSGSPSSVRKSRRAEVEHDMLWQRARPSGTLIAERSAAALNWRYFSPPEERFSMLEHFSGTTLDGYLILAERKLAGASFLGVYDLFVETPLSIEPLLRELAAHAVDRKLPIRFFGLPGMPMVSVLGALGFQGPFDGPIWVAYEFLGSDPVLADFASRPENWFLTLGDSDL
jgi:hypothetical protein